tara:strand:+ start:2523 stop:3500 length:978 start_codon:yes stop_codon:yes gene_type:complete
MFVADDEASAILSEHFQDQTFEDEYGRQVAFLDPDNAFFNRARYADHILPNADFYEAILAPSYPDNAVPAAFRALTEAAFDPDLGSEPAKAQQDVLDGLKYISEETAIQLNELEQAMFSGAFGEEDMDYALQVFDDFTQYLSSVDSLAKTVRAQGVRTGAVDPDYIENIKDIASVIAVLAGSGTRLTSLASVRAKIRNNWPGGVPNRIAKQADVVDHFQQNRQFWSQDPVQFNGNKVYQRNDLIDPNKVDPKSGKTNLELMNAGRAPFGSDGKPINLHHLTQKQDGAIAEVTQTLHSNNHGTLHIPNTVPSGINRAEFNTWCRNY